METCCHGHGPQSPIGQTYAAGVVSFSGSALRVGVEGTAGEEGAEVSLLLDLSLLKTLLILLTYFPKLFRRSSLADAEPGAADDDDMLAVGCWRLAMLGFANLGKEKDGGKRGLAV